MSLWCVLLGWCGVVVVGWEKLHGWVGGLGRVLVVVLRGG